MTIYHRTLRVLASITILAILGLVAGCNSTSLRPSAMTTSSTSAPAPIAESVQAPKASVAPAPTSTPLYSDGNAEITVSVFGISHKGDTSYTLPADGLLQFHASVFNKSPVVITILGIKARYADSTFVDAVEQTAKLTSTTRNPLIDVAEVGIGFIPGLGAIAGMFVAQQYETTNINGSAQKAFAVKDGVIQSQMIPPNSPSTGRYVVFPDTGKVVALTVIYTEGKLTKSYELSLLQPTVADTGAVAPTLK